jgi:hypothetical protein
MLEKALKSLDDEELAAARLHTKGKLSEEVWDTLWKGWRDQRSAIQSTLLAIDANCGAHIASLDDALNLIAKAGILFEKLDQQGQQRLLRHMVKRVVINPEGIILRMELRTPFSYLHEISSNTMPVPQPRLNGSRRRKNQTSRNAAGSILLQLGGPNEIQHEPPGSLTNNNLIPLLESIEYPQRYGLERLLTGTL